MSSDCDVDMAVSRADRSSEDGRLGWTVAEEEVDHRSASLGCRDEENRQHQHCSPGSHGEGSAALLVVACCWKGCKKVDKSTEGGSVFRVCSKRDCKRAIHAACATSMLGEFGASSTFDKIACGKRCFNSLVKAARASSKLVKKRVLWHNDGPTPNVSSMSVLIDWLTTGTNYIRYRGGDDQCGDSKNTLAGEIVQLIAEAGITTTRNAKDITNKITTLEASFRAAEDWLSNTGHGCDKNDPSIRAAILSRCSYYLELRDIMLDRPSTRPQLLNTDEAARKDDTDDDDEHSSDVESKSSEERPPTRVRADQLPASTPMSLVQQPPKRQRKTSDVPHVSFIKLKEAQLAQSRELQLMELEVRKRQVRLQEQEQQNRQQQLENEARAVNARIDESSAQALKYRQEAEHWRMQSKIALLRERKNLLDEGVAKEDIDALLPLATDF